MSIKITTTAPFNLEEHKRKKRAAKRRLRKLVKERNDGLRGRTKYMTAEIGKPIA